MYAIAKADIVWSKDNKTILPKGTIVKCDWHDGMVSAYVVRPISDTSLYVEGAESIYDTASLQKVFDILSDTEICNALLTVRALDDKLPDKRQLAYHVVEYECQRQDKKWGVQEHSDGKWSLIFDEEKGEACKAMLEGNDDEANAELIQCAAVIMQWLCDRAKRSNTS